MVEESASTTVDPVDVGVADNGHWLASNSSNVSVAAPVKTMRSIEVEESRPEKLLFARDPDGIDAALAIDDFSDANLDLAP